MCSMWPKGQLGKHWCRIIDIRLMYTVGKDLPVLCYSMQRFLKPYILQTTIANWKSQAHQHEQQWSATHLFVINWELYGSWRVHKHSDRSLPMPTDMPGVSYGEKVLAARIWPIWACHLDYIADCLKLRLANVFHLLAKSSQAEELSVTLKGTMVTLIINVLTYYRNFLYILYS